MRNAGRKPIRSTRRYLFQTVTLEEVPTYTANRLSSRIPHPPLRGTFPPGGRDGTGGAVRGTDCHGLRPCNDRAFFGAVRCKNNCYEIVILITKRLEIICNLCYNRAVID